MLMVCKCACSCVCMHANVCTCVYLCDKQVIVEKYVLIVNLD